MNNPYIVHLLSEQQHFADFRSKSYIFDPKGEKNPQRESYSKLLAYFTDFLESNHNPRWITITGFRGSGKTTLLFQLYNQIHTTDCYTLFLSLDHTYRFLGISLTDILISYEKSLGMQYEELDKPLILFLDEAQLDPTWLMALQDICARTKQVFIYVSGSMALRSSMDIKTDPRIIHEKLYPLSSPEYIKITKQKFQIPGLGESIRDAILYSENSEALYTALQHIAPEVNTYYKGSLQSDFYRYFSYGSLPHLLNSGDESQTYNQIQGTIDRILYKDLPVFKFHPDTVTAIPSMLFALADMDNCNVKKMAEKFDLSRSKMSEILDALEGVGLLRRIYPHGPYVNEVISRKPSKYLFSTPAFRIIYYRLLSDVISNKNTRYKMTEDLVAMYLYKIFDKIGKGSLMYDSSIGGADLVLTIDDISIIIQIGSGSDGRNQIIQTRTKIPSKYGIIITDNQLDFDSESGIIRMPLRMFLLM